MPVVGLDDEIRFRPLTGNLFSNLIVLVYVAAVVYPGFRPLTGNLFSNLGDMSRGVNDVLGFRPLTGNLFSNLSFLISFHEKSNKVSVPLRGIYFLIVVEFLDLFQIEKVSVPLRGIYFLIGAVAGGATRGIVKEFPSPYGESIF